MVRLHVGLEVLTQLILVRDNVLAAQEAKSVYRQTLISHTNDHFDSVTRSTLNVTKPLPEIASTLYTALFLLNLIKLVFSCLCALHTPQS